MDAIACHFLPLTWHHAHAAIQTDLISPRMAYSPRCGFLSFVLLQSVVKALSFISFRPQQQTAKARAKAVRGLRHC
jgi:hypothetical protein